MTNPPAGSGPYQKWPGERPFKAATLSGTAFLNPSPASAPNQARRGSGCLKTVLVAAGLVLAVAIASAVTGSGDDPGEPGQFDSGAPQVESGSIPIEEVPPAESESLVVDEPEVVSEEPSGPTFRGMKNSDEATVPGEILLAGRVGYTTSPLQQARTLGTRILCSAIAIANEETSEISFSYFEWKLQNPNGVISTPTVLDGGRPTLTSLGELAPGGSVQGDVCFEADATALPGEYVLFREESSFITTKKMAWVNSL